MKQLAVLLIFWVGASHATTVYDKNSDSLQVTDFSIDPTYYLGPDGKFEIIDREDKSDPPPFIYPKVNPTGVNHRPLNSSECNPEDLEDQLLNIAPAKSAKKNPIKAFFDQCESSLRKGAPKALSNLTSVEGIDYNLYRNPKINSIKIKMSNGEIVNGVLAMQDYQTPRPLIVVKCGMFCDSSKNGSSRNLVMHLFDESPFNLLLLENHSSIQNMKTNKRINFGGFYEGQELFTIGYWLRNESPLKHLISDQHSMGISLGGNAALFSSLYNDKNIPVTGQKVFDSVFAYCPAVNMKPTVEEVFKLTVKGVLVSLQTWYTINKVYGHVPDLQRVVDLRRPVPIKGYPQIIGEASLKFLNRQGPRSFLNPFKGVDLGNTTDTFWKINNFLNFSSQIETPLMVFASNDDSVVSFDLNTNALKRKAARNTTIVDLPIGEHCGLSFAYGWKVMSHIFRGHFLNMSPNYKKNYKREIRSAALPLPDLKSRESIANYEWIAHPNEKTISLTYYIYRDSGQKQECYRNIAYARHPKKYSNTSHCIRTEKFEMDLSEIPRTGLYVPREKVTAESLSRWLNAHVLLRDRDGDDVRSNSRLPQSLLITMPY